MASCWRDVGILLDFDTSGTELDNIETKYHGDPVPCCQAMFKHWLNGNGRGPHSWRTLIELLKDSDHKVLAGEVRSELLK